MNDVKIHESKEEDITLVAELLKEVFGEATEIDELKWLLSDPDVSNGFNSKYVLTNEKITGHVGFVRSSYTLKGMPLSGVHATNLCVNKQCQRGMGKKLFELVSYEPDVSIIYEGTPSAVRLYPKSGFKRSGTSELFSTIIALPSISELVNSSSIKTFIKKIVFSFRERFKRRSKYFIENQDVNFNPLNEDDSITHAPLDDALSNTPDMNKVKWLKRCPYLQSLIFTVKIKGAPVGILYLYINKSTENKTGRIVYMPNMGSEESYWESILAFSEKQFSSAQVRSYTIYASHPVLRKILIEKGFTKERDRTIWIYDSENKLNDATMHLMHLEGDHAFRNV